MYTGITLTSSSRLDSRLRKKQNAEKLEADKKLLTTQKTDLEETISQLENALLSERQGWMHDRQQYEQYIQQLQYDRDEAIRTKTLETAELRRQNNVLKDAVRELERQQVVRPFAADESDDFNNDFNNFKDLGLDDAWDDGFSLINNDDLKMEESDLQRQATPRPPATSTQAQQTKTKSDIKIDAAFSWETFYMCLLSGAFIMSQAGFKAGSASAVAVTGPSMPSLSDEYRAEAGNVLQAVLATGTTEAPEVVASGPRVDGNNFPHALSAMTPQSAETPLGNLHTSLTTPSRRQQAAAVFSLSADSYNHISSPDAVFDDNDDDELVEIKPTKLQQLFANMQAERDGLEKMTGLGSKARERSVLLDRVPEKVLRDFRQMIARVE